MADKQVAVCCYCDKKISIKKVLCDNCGAVFHPSCSTRRMCCEKQNLKEELVKSIDELVNENKLLANKNKQLSDENKLLKEKIHGFEREVKSENKINKWKDEIIKEIQDILQEFQQQISKLIKLKETEQGPIQSVSLECDKSKKVPDKLEKNAGNVDKDINLKQLEKKQEDIMNDIINLEPNIDILSGKKVTANGNESGNTNKSGNINKSDDGYTMVNRRKNPISTGGTQMYNNNNGNKVRMHKKQLGQAVDVNGKFEGRSPKVWMYIYRVSTGTSEEMIRSYLKTKTGQHDEEFIVQDLNAEGNSHKCFW